MLHRGWRIGRGNLEPVGTDRLTADRLAGFLSFLGSDSPGEPADSEGLESPEQTSEAELSPPTGTDGRKPGSSSPAEPMPPADSPPTVPLPTVPLPAVVAPNGVAPAVGVPTVVVATPLVTAAVALAAPAAAGANAVAAPAVVPDIDSSPASAETASPSASEVGPGAPADEVLAPADLAPSAVTKAAPVQPVSRTGRHRTPKTSRLSIRGISLSARRLALLASVTTLVVLTAVLALR